VPNEGQQVTSPASSALPNERQQVTSPAESALPNERVTTCRKCPAEEGIDFKERGGDFTEMIDSGRGTTKAEDAQGTPTQSHISPSILVYEDKLALLGTLSESALPSERMLLTDERVLYLHLPS